MSDLKWTEPPPSLQGAPRRSKWQSVADELSRNPRQWALIAEGVANTLAHTIRHGKSPAWAPAGAFEATSRKSQTGKGFDVYARYVGDAS